MRGIIHLIFILCGGVLFSSTASALTTHDCTLTKPVLINYGSQCSVVVNTTSQTQVFNVQISCPHRARGCRSGFDRHYLYQIDNNERIARASHQRHNGQYSHPTGVRYPNLLTGGGNWRDWHTIHS